MRLFLGLALLLLGAALALGSGACSVDRAGLDEMPIAPRDAGVDRVTGSAGFSGGAGAPDAADDATGAGGVGGTIAAKDAGAGGAAGGGGGGGGGVAGAGGSDAGTDAAAGAGGKGGAGGAAGAGGACGPTNCANGCCAGGKCVTNLSATQCGWAGAACAPCGGCQRCSATGACAVDPASRWLVLALSAELTAMAPGGGVWDPGPGTPSSSKPDPFCEFEIPPNDLTNAGVTDTIVDSFTATWDQTVSPVGQAIQASDLMSSDPNHWLLWVGDDEFNGSGTVACQVHPPMKESWLLSGQVTLTNIDNCKSLSIGLVCQP